MLLSESSFQYLQYGLVAVGAAWMAAEGVRSAHRRAYNLTKAETTGDKPIDPSFTKVDHEARKAALERGDAYARERAAAAAGPAAPAGRLAPWGRIARLTSKVVAAGIVALVPPTASGIASRDGVNFGVVDLAQKYPVGIGLAVVVLVISLVQLVRGRSQS
jgi:hypothetical protein